MASNHLADRHEPGRELRAVLLVLDRPVEPVFRIGRLRQAIETALEARRESPGVGSQAPLLDAPLRDDHVVGPGIDEADRALMACRRHGQLGVLGEAPDSIQLGPPG